MRLQEYGVGLFESLPTKSSWKKALKKGRVHINGKEASTGTLLVGKEEICLYMDNTAVAHKAFRCRLTVVYEDEYLAVVQKPAGILVSGNSFKTVANALPQNLFRSALPDATTPQPVHRLDYATTGLLLIGKTSSAIRSLNALFENKEVEKLYYAVTIGSMESKGLINLPIDGKNAISEFDIIETVPSERFKVLNLVQLSPKTGRRHQLRKHVASLGNPILGDRDYGKEGLVLKGKGMYLHANSLRFVHPHTNKEFHIVSEFPERFRKLFPRTKDA